MRTCRKCNEPKEESEFHLRNARKGTRSWYCKVCVRKYSTNYRNLNVERRKQYMKQYYRDGRGLKARQKTWGTKWDGIRLWIKELKGNNPCTDCGRIYHFSVMDLDHYLGTKSFNIASVMGRAISDDAILEEIQKCELVCSNCHRLRTWNRNNNTNQ